MSRDAGVTNTSIQQLARTPSQAEVRRPDETAPRGVDLRRWLLVALVVGYLLQVAWRLWMVRGLVAPAAHADEDGYLLTARALAGDAGGFTTDNRLFRRSGYPLMLSPVYWFTTNAFVVYRAAQLINALVNAAMFPLAYLFARRVFALPRGWSLGSAFAVALMPAVAFYSQFAMTDAVLAPFIMGWLLLIHAWLRAASPRGRRLAAYGAGGLAGWLSVVHVRGSMIVLVHLAMVGVFLLLRRTTWRTALGGAVVTGAVASLEVVLRLGIRGKMITTGRSPAGQTEAAVTTVHGILSTLGRAAGQLWYLGVGTWGLGMIGLLAMVLALWPWRGLRERLRAPVTGDRLLVLLTVLVGTVVIALASSASLPTTDGRINYHAYPRYIHFFFPIWMLAGIVALRGAPRRRVLTLVANSAAIVVLTGWLVRTIVRHSHDWLFLAFDAPESTLLGWRWHAIQVAEPTLAALVLLGAFAWAIPRQRVAAFALAGLIGLHLVALAVSVDKISKPMVVDQYRPDTPRLVRDAKLRPGDVVAESTRVRFPFQYNHMREVYWSRLILFDTRYLGPPEQATVVIAPYGTRTLDDWYGGRFYRLVVVDKHHHWAVWRRV